MEQALAANRRVPADEELEFTCNDDLWREVRRLRGAIRKHRDQRGDDRCYLDDRELYDVLPERYSPPASDSAVTIQQCQKFIDSRSDPLTQYVSPQRRVEELEAQVLGLREEIRLKDAIAQW